MLLEEYRLIAMPPAKWACFVLSEEKCNGCGRCVEACPVQLLMVDEKKARSNQRYDVFRCLTCQNCVAVCPEAAASIEGDYRVPEGFWKNAHLFSGGKTAPAPLGKSHGERFEDYEGELTETERVIYRRRSNRLYKKQQVDPDKPKVPLSGQRFRSQQEERHSPGRTAGRGGRRGRFCLSSLHTRVKITSVDKVWCRCDNAA